MKIYTEIDSIKHIKKPVVTIGTFDGVHLGHQKIIERIRQLALKEDGESVIFTFFPHPRMVLEPDNHDLKLITTQEEKIKLLEAAGVDNLIIFPFTSEFSKLSSEEFVKNILVDRIGVKKLVIGYNHHFGHNREGSFNSLNSYAPVYGFEVEEIPAKDVENVNVSSTKIREAILSGDIKTANRYLGYDFMLSGTVVEGEKLGRTIGFPTANIKVNENYKIIPARGVYAVAFGYKNRKYAAMLNIGIRPTMGGVDEVIEVNVFDFDETIYGQTVTVHFIERIRNEIRFNGVEALKNQLKKDKKSTLEILNSMAP